MFTKDQIQNTIENIMEQFAHSNETSMLINDLTKQSLESCTEKTFDDESEELPARFHALYGAIYCAMEEAGKKVLEDADSFEPDEDSKYDELKLKVL